jgi:predicted HAD superfamily Cof-like phosphohydrolase
MTIKEFMSAHLCNEFEDLAKKLTDYVALCLELEDSPFRCIIAFNEVPAWVENGKNRMAQAVYSTFNTLVYTDDTEVNGYKIKGIRPITKKELTDTELYNMFSDIGNVFDDTKKFQEFYGLMEANESKTEPPYFISKDKLDVKIGHLKEELAEIEKAAANGDLVEFADGIIDLIYVAAGLGALCRLPMHQLWNDVQNSNMVGKERVTSLDNATKRGTTFDVRKGPNWVGPRGADIIKIATEKRQNKKNEG